MKTQNGNPMKTRNGFLWGYKVKKYTVLLAVPPHLCGRDAGTHSFWVYAIDPDVAVMHARHKQGKRTGVRSALWDRFTVVAVYEGHLWDENPESDW